MSRRERLVGIWLMSMTLLSLCSYTVFYVAKMLPWIYSVAYLVLATMQIIALVIYMWGPDKLRFKPLKVVYRLLCVSSILVIPFFMLQFMGLISQYHAEIPDSVDATSMQVEEIRSRDETVVYDTGVAYVIFPAYSSIELVCENRPSQSDESITWCSGAAFHHSVNLGFSQDDIEGDHATSGAFYESQYFQEGFAALVFADGAYSFEFDDPSEAIRDAANSGGSGFMQYGLIRDGKPAMDFEQTRVRCFRLLAELNGSLCIIDSKKMMYFDDFMDEAYRLGVTNALYMDMGAGWNYSWYRNASGNPVTLFSFPVPWSHNWLVMRK